MEILQDKFKNLLQSWRWNKLKYAVIITDLTSSFKFEWLEYKLNKRLQ